LPPSSPRAIPLALYRIEATTETRGTSEPDIYNFVLSVTIRVGDFAGSALDLLAEDPAFAEPIRVMSRNVADKRYIDPATIALTTAALLVLQTRVKFKRGQNGKWSVEVEKKAAGDGAVKALVQRLLGLLGG
jgi:hypothetical protein